MCLLGALVINVAGQTPQQDVEVVRTETDLTNLPFSVSDKNNRYLTTLKESDIRVLEDGVVQKLFTFQQETDQPLSIAFLIDVSGSEERTLPREKAAARTFIENVIKSSKDQAAIIPFEGYAHLEQPLTRDVIGIYRALERVDDSGSVVYGFGSGANRHCVEARHRRASDGRNHRDLGCHRPDLPASDGAQ